MRNKQEDQKFKAILGYMESLLPAWDKLIFSQKNILKSKFYTEKKILQIDYNMKRIKIINVKKETLMKT